MVTKYYRHHYCFVSHYHSDMKHAMATVEDPEITYKVARKNYNGTKCLALTYLRVGSCIHKLYDKCATKIK
jgi:hypothetical protein